MRRLSGEPDSKNSFPNLKTLRDYIEQTGKPIEKFRFDMQIGNSPTERSKSKIYPEEHHLAEMEERFEYEESAFAADLRSEERPIDVKLNGGQKKLRKPKAKSQTPSLFEIAES
jgi:adenine-specific DNA-methyltransferase